MPHWQMGGMMSTHKTVSMGLVISLVACLGAAGCDQDPVGRRPYTDPTSDPASQDEESVTTSATTSSDPIAPSCGNRALDPGETCDTGILQGEGVCPKYCNDADQCTQDVLIADGCNSRCEFHPIVNCSAMSDGCCPVGCTANNDPDCKPSCGNGALDAGELCDTVIPAGELGACKTNCDDGVACTADSLIGEGCASQCQHLEISACGAQDGCCPAGCTQLTDPDCGAACGDGVLDKGEQCDTGISSGLPGACPLACADQNACTSDTLIAAGSCGASCVFAPITQCASGDGCCPAGCNEKNDGDCKPTCGNGVIDQQESCDIAVPAGESGACPTSSSCDDGNACTEDKLIAVGTCGASCSHTLVQTCKPKEKDGCCPSGCGPKDDADCKAQACGNGVRDAGELCDTAAIEPSDACPLAANDCDDQDPSTEDTLVGSGCQTMCKHQPITTCRSGDGFCPASCNQSNDADCAPRCGNNVIEPGEQCDSAARPSGVEIACFGCTSGCKCLPRPNDGKPPLPPLPPRPEDPAPAPVCGNRIVESGEKCDGDVPCAVLNQAKYSKGVARCFKCLGYTTKGCILKKPNKPKKPLPPRPR
jgi:hypothetical protein